MSSDKTSSLKASTLVVSYLKVFPQQATLQICQCFFAHLEIFLIQKKMQKKDARGKFLTLFTTINSVITLPKKIQLIF